MSRMRLRRCPFSRLTRAWGLERTATVLGGYKSVFDTDAFKPILKAISQLSIPYGLDHSSDRAMRIVADHLRTACFCIADGILPSNTGRGYVLRRLIRRAVLKGFRTLQISDPFMSKLVGPVVNNLGAFYTELAERQDTISEILGNEEAMFRRTLERGLRVFANRAYPLVGGVGHLSDVVGSDAPWKTTWAELVQAAFNTRGADREPLSGHVAFDLYAETYGFPVEVTSELCGELELEVDMLGYEYSLVQSQKRSRSGQERQTVYGGTEGDRFLKLPATRFVGYDRLVCSVTLLGAREHDGEIEAVFDQTPLYAASGGQVSDAGIVTAGSVESDVIAIAKRGGIFVHTLKPRGSSLEALAYALESAVVTATVTESHRRPTIRNHTATHLLHAALRKHLGTHVDSGRLLRRAGQAAV